MNSGEVFWTGMALLAVGALMPVTGGGSAAAIPWIIGGTGAALALKGNQMKKEEDAAAEDGGGGSGEIEGASIEKTGGLTAGTEDDYKKGFIAGRADGTKSIGSPTAKEPSFNAKASVKWQSGYRDGFESVLRDQGASMDEDGNIDWYGAGDVAKGIGSIFS